MAGANALSNLRRRLASSGLVARGRTLARQVAARPTPPTAAWFDQPDALAQIPRRASDEPGRAILTSWVNHGYAIVEQMIPHDLLDAMIADVDRLFTAGGPTLDVAVEGLMIDGDLRPKVSHRELLELSPAAREAARDVSSWRVHAMFTHSAAADAVRQHPDLRRVASMILGTPSEAHYSINFHNGSTQGLHEDTAVFHLGVPTLICGAWIACEDVVQGSGPLRYYPGSHRRGLYAGFDDYPHTNLRTAEPETYRAYCAHIEEESTQYEPANFLARKGDVLFWHGMLIHGGAPITRPKTTRRSYVLHFIPGGIDVIHRIAGRTNW